MTTAAAPGRIALIRHGETEWSATGRHTSVTDVDLTARGEQQARRVPDTLACLGISPVMVLVSPRLRARRTAALAGLSSSTIVDGLAEWAYGEYEGLTSAEIEQLRPDWSLFVDGAPGGESVSQVTTRVTAVLERVRPLLATGDVALVCHGHIARALAACWVGLDASGARLLRHDPGCVTVLGTYHSGEPILDAANVPSPPRPIAVPVAGAAAAVAGSFPTVSPSARFAPAGSATAGPTGSGPTGSGPAIGGLS